MIRAANTVILGTLCALAMAVAGCGGDDSTSPTSTAPKASAIASTSSGGGATIASSPMVAASSPAAQGKVPGDACALLTADDLSKLTATAGSGKKSSPSGVPGQSIAACRWEWSEGTSSLDVKVSSIPAGVTADLLKTSLQAQAKSNGRELSGVGDFAIVVSPINADTVVRILFKGVQVDIELNGLGARDKQEQLITLAKAALGRM